MAEVRRPLGGSLSGPASSQGPRRAPSPRVPARQTEGDVPRTPQPACEGGGGGQRREDPETPRGPEAKGPRPGREDGGGGRGGKGGGAGLQLDPGELQRLATSGTRGPLCPELTPRPTVFGSPPLPRRVATLPLCFVSVFSVFTSVSASCVSLSGPLFVAKGMCVGRLGCAPRVSGTGEKEKTGAG